MRPLPAKLATVGILCTTMASDCGQQAECGDCYPEGYLVKVIGAPVEGVTLPAVLYSGYRNGSCQDDVLCTGTPDAFLGDLDRGLLDWKCDAADQELIVFAGGYSPTLRREVLTGSELSVTLEGMKSLPVVGWVLPGFGPPDEPLDWVETQLEMARRIMDDLGTGIRVDYQVRAFPAEQVDAFQQMIDEAGCSYRDRLRQTSLNPAAGAPPVWEENSLNVYYVTRIIGGRRGLTCFEDRPYMTFVADLLHTPAVTAHELGHALGIQSRATLPSGELGYYPGDVDDLELIRYFPLDNLMQSGVTDVGQVTIGQIYRMHFDDRSWLRRLEQPLSDGYPRRCQGSPILGGPCPPLTLHPPRGWR